MLKVPSLNFSVLNILVFQNRSNSGGRKICLERVLNMFFAIFHLIFASFCFFFFLFTLFKKKHNLTSIWHPQHPNTSQIIQHSLSLSLSLSICHCKLQIWQLGRVRKWTKKLKSNCRFNNIWERQKFLGNQSLLLLAIHRAVLPSMFFHMGIWHYIYVTSFPVFHNVKIVILSFTSNGNKHSLSKDLNGV